MALVNLRPSHTSLWPIVRIVTFPITSIPYRKRNAERKWNGNHGNVNASYSSLYLKKPEVEIEHRAELLNKSIMP